MALKTQISVRAVRDVALGKANAARLSGDYKRQRQRTRRILFGILKSILSAIVFGSVVRFTAYSPPPSVSVPATPDSSVQVNEVTRLYPVTMERVVTPHSVEDI